LLAIAVLPRRLPRQVEPLFSGAHGSTALVYGAAGGGGPLVDAQALERAIKAGAPPAEDVAVAGVAASWVNPVPPSAARGHEADGASGVKAHRQLKPVVR